MIWSSEIAMVLPREASLNPNILQAKSQHKSKKLKNNSLSPPPPSNQLSIVLLWLDPLPPVSDDVLFLNLNLLIIFFKLNFGQNTQKICIGLFWNKTLGQKITPRFFFLFAGMDPSLVYYTALRHFIVLSYGMGQEPA